MSILKITTRGLDTMVRRTEERLRAATQGPGIGVMTEVGRAGMADVDERFATAGYGTWAPLSPITIARKGHAEILIDSGNMRGSVGIGEVTAYRVTVTVPYGGRSQDSEVPGRHQRGNPDTNLPQRKIVEVTDQLHDRIRPVVLEWVRSW